MSNDCFSLDSYLFDVPQDLIAQVPAEPRDHARLMIVDRKSGSIDEGIVADLPDLLSPEDVLILNNTKVLHAALRGWIGDRQIDCLLTRSESPFVWWVLAKPARKLMEGAEIRFLGGVEARVLSIGTDGQRRMEFSEPLTVEKLQEIGGVPLPPYIQRDAPRESDGVRYQTIYGCHPGSVAAPTAGLHFTNELFSRLDERGIEKTFVTLHVGTGTFLPIRVPDIRQHQMHTESFDVSEATAETINALPSTSRRVAVGTTSLRVLESVAAVHGMVVPGPGATNLFVHPGYQFRVVSTLFTNFHTPGSSLLVLVSAFMGYDLMKEVYRKAIERRFRLFSYGDAMLIL